MAETTTTRLALIKPVPGSGELVDQVDHLNGNWDKVDAAIGATVCTSGTRPASPYDGQFIRETDTRRLLVWNATQSNWDQILAQGGTFAVPGGGATATWRLYTTSPAAANRAFAFRGSGDTQDRFIFDYDGAMQWGTGTAAADTGMYRSGVNELSVNAKMRAGTSVAVQTEETADVGNTISFNAGAPVCGVAFVAPPSGKVACTISGYGDTINNGNEWQLSFEVRNGSTIGAGTVVLAASDARMVGGPRSVTTGGAATGSGSYRYMLSGLTSGSSYNMRAMNRSVPGASGTTYHRTVLVEPIWA